MGSRLVREAMGAGQWAMVGSRAQLVLLVMAQHAMDQDGKRMPAHVYARGWDALALALGYPDAKPNSAGKQAVARAIRELRNAGLIRPAESRWHHTAYLVLG